MKAITVKQPWAFLICAGVKDVENRTWNTKFRGRVLIHVSAKPEKRLSVLSKAQYETACKELQSKNLIPTMALEDWDKSAIIGSVEIVDCVQNHPSIWAEKTREVRTWANGTEMFIPINPVYNWVLANPVLFEKPIENVKGKLSFWEYKMIDL